MNRKGFGTIGIILGIVAIATIIGYVAFTNRSLQPTIGEQSQTKGDQLLTEQKNLANCFREKKLTTDINKSNWKTFEGFGFAIKYPAESVSISSVGNPSNGEEFTFEISSLVSPHKSNIKVYRLRQEVYRAAYINTATVAYESYSDTWWRDDYAYRPVWDPLKFEQCNPNSIGKTDDGKYNVYLTSDGDVGAFFMNYFVVLRDIVKTADYEPLVVEFKTYGNSNNSNFSTYQAFLELLENIIGSLKLQPTLNSKR